MCLQKVMETIVVSVGAVINNGFCKFLLDEDLVGRAVVKLLVLGVGFTGVCDSGVVVEVSQLGDLEAVTGAHLRHRSLHRLYTNHELVEVIRIGLAGGSDLRVVNVGDSLRDIKACEVLVQIYVVFASAGSERGVHTGLELLFVSPDRGAGIVDDGVHRCHHVLNTRAGIVVASLPQVAARAFRRRGVKDEVDARFEIKIDLVASALVGDAGVIGANNHGVDRNAVIVSFEVILNGGAGASDGRIVD